jgi:uncharacterized repeat protein (TIGR01451 family)
MTQPSKIRWFVFTAATLLLLAGGASAQTYVTPTVATSPPAQGQLIVVNNGPGDQTQPHVDGDLVCYTDDSTGTSLIRYFNLVTKTDGAVPNNGSSSDFFCDVRGTTIVFTRTSGVESDVFTFDAASATLTEIDPTPGSQRFVGQIGDATIAWQESTTPSSITSGIIAYDRPTATTTVLAPFLSSLNQNPAISSDGNVLVWEDCLSVNGPCLIWKATRSSAGTWTTQQLVSQVQGDQRHPDTDGVVIAYSANFANPSGTVADRIVWQPAGGGMEQVLNIPGSAINPTVNDGLIAFDYDATVSGFHQIAVYDTVSNVLYKLTSDAPNKALNDISVTPDGKVRVVWQVFENDFNLYAYTFNLPVADLAIQKFGFPSTVHVGQDIAYGLLVHNLGPNTANDVLVTDPLPANTVLVGAFPSQGSCSGPAPRSGGTVTCKLGSLVNGRYAIVGIAVKVIGGAGTTITNTATVGGSTFDPSPKDNSASVSTMVAQP